MTRVKQIILDQITLEYEYEKVEDKKVIGKEVVGKILQFGIVATPDYTFKINGSDIIVGKTGIYELSTVNFQQTTLTLLFSDESEIILDLLYDDNQGLEEKKILQETESESSEEEGDEA